MIIYLKLKFGNLSGFKTIRAAELEYLRTLLDVYKDGNIVTCTNRTSIMKLNDVLFNIFSTDSDNKVFLNNILFPLIDSPYSINLLDGKNIDLFLGVMNRQLPIIIEADAIKQNIPDELLSNFITELSEVTLYSIREDIENLSNSISGVTNDDISNLLSMFEISNREIEALKRILNNINNIDDRFLELRKFLSGKNFIPQKYTYNALLSIFEKYKNIDEYSLENIKKLGILYAITKNQLNRYEDTMIRDNYNIIRNTINAHLDDAKKLSDNYDKLVEKIKENKNFII